MRLDLPTTGAALWEQLTAKVRNQVKKGINAKFSVHWGDAELLDPFYDVFSRNMRDLGTPTYSREFFRAILHQFPDTAELCVVRDRDKPIAGALLLHGRGITEVPSASSLREYRKSNANMWMYWNLLERSAERRQEVFDFGRSTIDSPTFQFKKQWGATPYPAEWQYYVRTGAIDHVRPDNPKYRWKIALWRKLPVSVTRRLGPMIVRGIP
jgi:FemAB-related protein (PEP-CTERM system-associated)